MMYDHYITVLEEYNDDDLTMLMVPQETVGFVTGRAGNFLRTIEEEPLGARRPLRLSLKTSFSSNLYIVQYYI